MDQSSNTENESNNTNEKNNISNTDIADSKEVDTHCNKSFISRDTKCCSNLLIEFVFNKNLQHYFQHIIGNYYVWLHMGIMTMGIYIIMFSMNQIALLFVIIVLAIDAFTIIILHDCPLTMLERYYIKHSSVYWRLNKLRNSGIKYSLENEYDIQLEVVINGAAMAIFKLFCIIVLQSKPFI